MPIETIMVLSFIVLVFATFAVGLAWADYQTREFRE
jgi:hypothetical protein